MTQIVFVLKQLAEKGEVSRNFCLRNFISRLGARIADLKREGLVFKTETRPCGIGWEGNDYIYSCDKKKASKLLKNLNLKK